MNGILIVNKPSGVTSHDIVDFVRKRFNIKKVGHSGTLDPLATGVLVMLIGKGTKLFEKFVTFDKEYEAVITLGAFTTTGDSQGDVLQRFSFESVTRRNVLDVFEKLKKQEFQVPPMFSALRYKGRRLYKLARKGIDVPRPPRRIKIYNLELLDFLLPNVHFCFKCSKGTYVRSFAEDVGKGLDCGGYISSIKRIGLGPFSLADAVELEKINESHIRPWQEEITA